MLEYTLYIISLTAILALAVLGIQIQLGRIGLLNMGHIALFGIGAYTFIRLYNAGLPLLPCLLVALVLAAVIGTVLMAIGNPLKPDAFILMSFGFLEAVRALAIHFRGVTNGVSGLVTTSPPDVSVGSAYWLYLVAALVLFYTVASFLARSKIGLIWHSIKEHEVLAQSLGFATYRYKLLVAAIAGACSGLAGAFFGAYINYIDPTIFSLMNLISQLTMAIISGVGAIWETIMGSFSLNGITEGLRFLPIPSTYLGPLRQLFYSLLLLGILALGARITFKREKQ